MPAPGKLTALQQRKRLLVLQTDLHRALVRVECANVREKLGWLTDAREKARSAGPWLAVGAAAIGLLAVSRWRKASIWITTALAAWRAVQQLKSRQ